MGNLDLSEYVVYMLLARYVSGSLSRSEYLTALNIIYFWKGRAWSLEVVK